MNDNHFPYVHVDKFSWPKILAYKFHWSKSKWIKQGIDVLVLGDPCIAHAKCVYPFIAHGLLYANSHWVLKIKTVLIEIVKRWGTSKSFHPRASVLTKQ